MASSAARIATTNPRFGRASSRNCHRRVEFVMAESRMLPHLARMDSTIPFGFSSETGHVFSPTSFRMRPVKSRCSTSHRAASHRNPRPVQASPQHHPQGDLREAPGRACINLYIASRNHLLALYNREKGGGRRSELPNRQRPKSSCCMYLHT